MGGYLGPLRESSSASRQGTGEPSGAAADVLEDSPVALVIDSEESAPLEVGPGPPLPATTVLSDDVCLIAAASRELCDAIVECLHRD